MPRIWMTSQIFRWLGGYVDGLSGTGLDWNFGFGHNVWGGLVTIWGGGFWVC